MFPTYLVPPPLDSSKASITPRVQDIKANYAVDSTVDSQTEAILHERAQIVTQFSPFYQKFIQMRSGENGDINIQRLFFIFNDANLVLSYPAASIEIENFKPILDLTPETGISVLS